MSRFRLLKSVLLRIALWVKGARGGVCHVDSGMPCYDKGFDGRMENQFDLVNSVEGVTDCRVVDVESRIDWPL